MRRRTVTLGLVPLVVDAVTARKVKSGLFDLSPKGARRTMASAGYPVTQTSYTLFREGQRQPAIVLINSGTVGVYVDNAPQNSNTQGFLLNAGAVLPWQAGLPCYLVCPTGTGLVTTSDNYAGFTYNDPIALANAIVGPANLPGQIATAINLVGVPTVDVPATLYTATIATVSGNVPAASPLLNLSAYQSINVYFNELGLSGSTVLREVRLTWYEDAGGTQLAGYDVMVLGTFGGEIAGTMPRRAAYLQVTYSASATAGATTLKGRITGSYNAVGQMRVYNNPGIGGTLTQSVGPGSLSLSGHTGLCIFSGSINATTTQSGYPIFYPGQCELSWYAGQTGVSLLVLTADGALRIDNPVNVNAALHIEMLLPNYPVELRLQNTTAGAVSYSIALKSLSAYL